MYPATQRHILVARENGVALSVVFLEVFVEETRRRQRMRTATKRRPACRVRLISPQIAFIQRSDCAGQALGFVADDLAADDVIVELQHDIIMDVCCRMGFR